MACPNLDKVLESLWPTGKGPQASVWAVLDGARDPRIFPLLRDSGFDYLCLFSGYLPRELQMAAPYLVELNPEGAFTRRLINLAWGNSWGIFVNIHDSTLLRHHLRKFLRVQDEQGKYMLFRYYDPRVLRAYLPTCLPNELKTIFGPIGRYLIEDKEPETLIEFIFNGFQLEKRLIQLQTPNGQ